MLRVRFSKYRTYERDTTSGGGSTSGAGGSSTPTSSTQAAHNHKFAHFQGPASAPGVWSGYQARDADGGGTFGFTVGLNPGEDMWTYEANGSHSHSVSIGSHSHSTPNHVHQQTYDIYEHASWPGPVSVYLDGQNIDSVLHGPWQPSDANRTFDADLGEFLAGIPGWHTLRFEAASGLGRVTPYLIVKSYQEE